MCGTSIKKKLRELAQSTLEDRDCGPMDGDETEDLSKMFLFFLDEVHGNLDKEELEEGYKLYNVED